MRSVAIAASLLALVLGGAGAARAVGSTDTTTTTTTVDLTAPSAPTLTSATAGPDGIALKWAAPASNGGSSLTGFRLYRATGKDAATLLATFGLVDSFTDASVVAGTTYSYEVSAVNAIGEGPVSNALFATATSPSSTALFQTYQATAVGSSPEAVAIGDVNGDGRNDVVMTTSFNFDPADDFRLFVFLQTPDGALLPPVSYATAATYVNRATSVSIGDLTGDGRADVVVGVSGVGVQVFPQLSSGALGSPTMYPTPDSNKIRLGQLDGDGRLDVAGVGVGTNTISVLSNDGHGGLGPPVTYPVQHAGAEDLEVGDVTGDGRDDLVVMSGVSYAVPNVSVLAQVVGGFGTPTEYTVAANTNTQGIGLGDVTGDGRDDVVASFGGNRPSSQLAVLPQGSGGALLAPTVYPSYDIPGPVDVADLDLDGRPDVVVLHEGWLDAGVYRQQVGGALGPEELFALPYASTYNPHGLAVGDVNGDGSPDVVVADYNNGLVVLRNTTAPTSAPGPPELTGAIPSAGSISLTWSPPGSRGGAPSGYRVYRGTASGGETLLATLGTTTTYTDASAAGGTTYYYEVTAANSLGEGARSNERAAGISTVPAAPQLSSAAGGNGSVSLTWSAPASDGGAAITGYKVYRGTSSGGETLLANVGNVTAYTDATAVNGQTYDYEVSAVNAVGEGARSNERSATPATVPGAPSLLSAKAGNGGAALAWAPPGSNGGASVTAYRIYRGSSSGGETLLATVGAVTAYTDTTAPNGKTSYYQVSAVNSAGEGARSNELTAKRGR